MTDWKWRLILIVHIDANTADNRTAFAQAFVDNGSGETLENERKLFDYVQKLALSATPTVHRAFGITTPVKAGMRDDLLAVIQTIDATLTAAKKSVYYGVANVDNAPFTLNEVTTLYQRGECFYANRAEDSDFIGQVLTTQMILTRLGLVVME